MLSGPTLHANTPGEFSYYIKYEERRKSKLVLGPSGGVAQCLFRWRTLQMALGPSPSIPDSMHEGVAETATVGKRSSVFSVEDNGCYCTLK
jgi:hypothetical protein